MRRLFCFCTGAVASKRHHTGAVVPDIRNTQHAGAVASKRHQNWRAKQTQTLNEEQSTMFQAVVDVPASNTLGRAN